MINGSMNYGIANNSMICIPGIKSKNGIHSDSLEGFARTFLLYSFLSKGEIRYRASNEAKWFVDGLEEAGCNQTWPQLRIVGQARVEAALLAIGLDITRDWIWNKLSHKAQCGIAQWMSSAVGDDSFPFKNWIWFRLIIETFLRSVDGLYSLDEMKGDLNRIDSLYFDHGWYSDGPKRAFDHYNGWSFHVYPTLWSRMMGSEDLAQERIQKDRDRLKRYVQDAIYLVGGNGAPFIQGRSLIYRFATAAPFCAAVIEGIDDPSIGQMKKAIFDILRHFMNRPIMKDGYLSIGWFDEWNRLSQSYSGSGSPYWAGKGLMCLMLPEDHPFWTIDEEKLPVEIDNQLKIIKAPGWVVSSTKEDGIVRVYNFGTDSTNEGEYCCDSPLYARWMYSTHTFPLLNDDSWIEPKDCSSTIVMKNGDRTHRSGWRRIEPIEVQNAVCVGIRSELQCILPFDNQKYHGAGYTGKHRSVGSLISLSVIRDKWEIRIDYIEGSDKNAVKYEVSGWGIAIEREINHLKQGLSQTVSNNNDLFSTVIGYYGFDNVGSRQVEEASPISEYTVVPYVTSEVVDGIHVCGLSLFGGNCGIVPEVQVNDKGRNSVIDIHWTDRENSTIELNSIYF